MKLRLTDLILPLAPIAVIAAGWQLLVHSNPTMDFTLGSPAGICRELASLLRSKLFYRDVGVTALETLLGFLSGTVLGTVLGLAMWTSRTAFTIARPYLVALGAVPVFALGPVLIFWFGTGLWSKVVLGFLATFVVALTQSYTGALEVDKQLVRLTRAFGGTTAQVFWRIVVPSSAIWVLSGLRLSIGMALLGAFVGEFISSRMGLGHMIILAEGLYNVNQIWVGTLGIIAIALVFYSLTAPVEHWAKRWR